MLCEGPEIVFERDTPIRPSPSENQRAKKSARDAACIALLFHPGERAASIPGALNICLSDVYSESWIIESISLHREVTVWKLNEPCTVFTTDEFWSVHRKQSFEIRVPSTLHRDTQTDTLVHHRGHTYMPTQPSHPLYFSVSSLHNLPVHKRRHPQECVCVCVTCFLISQTPCNASLYTSKRYLQESFITNNQNNRTPEDLYTPKEPMLDVHYANISMTEIRQVYHMNAPAPAAPPPPAAPPRPSPSAPRLRLLPFFCCPNLLHLSSYSSS